MVSQFICYFNSLFRLTTEQYKSSALQAVCEDNPIVTGLVCYQNIAAGCSLQNGPKTPDSKKVLYVIVLKISAISKYMMYCNTIM